jgi:serine/threonine-protein kinase
VLVGVDGVSRDYRLWHRVRFRSRHGDASPAASRARFAYIAPEQVKSQHATRRMDIFSAGAVLWEALTGRSLFRRKDDATTVDARSEWTHSAPIPVRAGPTGERRRGVAQGAPAQPG